VAALPPGEGATVIDGWPSFELEGRRQVGGGFLVSPSLSVTTALRPISEPARPKGSWLASVGVTGVGVLQRPLLVSG
jgi:hypothetical protein